MHGTYAVQSRCEEGARRNFGTDRGPQCGSHENLRLARADQGHLPPQHRCIAPGVPRESAWVQINACDAAWMTAGKTNTQSLTLASGDRAQSLPHPMRLLSWQRRRREGELEAG